MFIQTRINLILAVMVSLCLGSVMAAQAPASSARDSVSSAIDNGSSSISQRAEALVVNVLLEPSPRAPQLQQLPTPVLVGNDSNSSSGAGTGGVSGIEMPFFSFGGASAE